MAVFRHPLQQPGIPQDKVKGVRLSRATHPLLLDALLLVPLRQQDRRIEHVVVRDLEDDVGLFRRGQDTVRAGQIVGHRLLKGDVFSRLRRVNHDCFMHGVGDEDFDRLDHGVLQQVEVVCVGPFRLPLALSALRSRRVRVAHGMDPGFGVALVAEGVKVGDPTAADDPYIYPLHGAGPPKAT